MEKRKFPLERSMQFRTEECLDCDWGGNAPSPFLSGCMTIAKDIRTLCNKELILLVVGNWDWDSSLDGDAWPILSVFLDAGSLLDLYLILTLVIL
jgi:hypothetical protein